jgi:hypothetical protein
MSALKMIKIVTFYVFKDYFSQADCAPSSLLDTPQQNEIFRKERSDGTAIATAGQSRQ